MGSSSKHQMIIPIYQPESLVPNDLSTAAEVNPGGLLVLSSTNLGVVLRVAAQDHWQESTFWKGFLQAKMSGSLISWTVAYYYHKVKGTDLVYIWDWAGIS